MSQPTYLSMRPLAAAVLVTLAASAQAANIGINPRTGQPVVNPFTGQTTDAWKWVGKASGCTAILITPQWVMSTAHCPAGAASGYTNDQLTPGVEHALMFNEKVTLADGSVVSACTTVMLPPTPPATQPEATDQFICRLKAPGGITGHGPMLPLVAAPVSNWLPGYYQLADGTAGWGSLMLYGRAGPDLLSFVGFNGLPHQWSAITDPTGATIPELVGGDSGGAIFSYSPVNGQVALTGLTTHPLQFLMPEAIAFIQRHIQLLGDTPPRVVDTAAHFGDTSRRSAKDLATPPAATVQANGQLQVRWTPPADASVTGYALSYGTGGAIQGRQSLGTTSTQALVPTNGASSFTACVQPTNAIGPANAGWVRSRYPGSKFFSVPNCSTFDLRAPEAPQLTLDSVYDASIKRYRMTARWTHTGPTASPSTQVNTRTAYPTGPARTTSAALTTTSLSSWVAPGAEFCVTATGISQVGVRGAPSPTLCRKAQ